MTLSGNSQRPAKRTSVVVVLPTYNEAENLPLLLPALLALPVSVCVVDDNSPDGSGAIAEAWREKDPRVFVLHRPAKLGLGTAYQAGFRWALEQGFSGVITMDADFSHHPCYVPALLKEMDNYDLVIGSRYVPGGEVRYPFHRRLLSRMANWIAHTALRLQPHDCTAGFRLYRAEVLRTVPIDTIFSNGYSYLLEMVELVQRYGFRIGEVPIIFEDRVRGRSKISFVEIIKAAYTVARLASRRARHQAQARPRPTQAEQ